MGSVACCVTEAQGGPRPLERGPRSAIPSRRIHPGVHVRPPRSSDDRRRTRCATGVRGTRLDAQEYPPKVHKCDHAFVPSDLPILRLSTVSTGVSPGRTTSNPQDQGVPMVGRITTT